MCYEGHSPGKIRTLKVEPETGNPHSKDSSLRIRAPPWALGLTLLLSGSIVKCEHIKEDVGISLLLNFPAESLSSLQAQPISLHFQQL